MMSARELEESQNRKVSHDVSAFRARQVRSEIFNDSFQPGQLSRPKSLDNLSKISGFRSSNETLSSASAVTFDQAPSRHHRRSRPLSPPASPPTSAFRVVRGRNESPYSTPNTAKRSDVLRRNQPLTPQDDHARKMKGSPQSLTDRDSSQHSGDSARATSPSPSQPRSRRSSFSSAVSAHESDHEVDHRRDEVVTPKRTSTTERPPPPYQGGLDGSMRSDRSDDSSPQVSRSSRGPPPPYHRPSVDDTKLGATSSVSSEPERRPPSYTEAAKSLSRTPSIRSKSGTPRDMRPSPRQEQRTWETQSTPQSRRTEPPPMDLASPIDKNSSINSEPEILIDATQSTVSAIPIGASPSSSQTKTNKESTVVSTFFQPVESLQESPLRRMNSMPRYNTRSKSMEESYRRKESAKTADTLFAAVLVRQRSLSDNPPRPDEPMRRPKDLPGLTSTSGQPSSNSSVREDDGRTSRSEIESIPERHNEDGNSDAPPRDRQTSDSESEGRSKSRSGTRTPQRGKGTHQWLEYGCV